MSRMRTHLEPKNSTVCAPPVNFRKAQNFNVPQYQPYIMAIRYNEALGMLKQVAVETLGREDRILSEDIPLETALGRIAGQQHVSPTATPSSDIAATDGFAISSVSTANATKNRPVTFVVKGTIAAGDELPLCPSTGGGGIPSCFEVKSGARFPDGTGNGALDACVKVEDVVSTVLGSEKMITVVQPVPRDANRRFAGSDLQAGQGILTKGEKIQSIHVMALASAGISMVTVQRKLRVAVCSTKKEVACHSPQTQPNDLDANSLFLLAALRELAIDAEMKGGFNNVVSGADLQQGAYDVVLTTSAEYDSVVPALKARGARIRFHGIAIRPGHPTLFATLPTLHGDLPLIGLPGDAMATAACFRFLVAPLILQLSGARHDVSKIVRLQANNRAQDLLTCCPPHLDCFRHGWIRKGERGEEVVLLSPDQSPEKVSHFAASNCWVHVPRGHSGSYRDTLVYCYAHIAGMSP
ncbi:hypothetical protein N0V90_009085 [Kalmusia sp. IMI 367209]|nr:hypothetical protein N0V90_009085 [Kalmusia sp. IMI 367209]